MWLFVVFNFVCVMHGLLVGCLFLICFVYLSVCLFVVCIMIGLQFMYLCFTRALRCVGWFVWFDVFCCFDLLIILCLFWLYFCLWVCCRFVFCVVVFAVLEFLVLV